MILLGWPRLFCNGVRAYGAAAIARRLGRLFLQKSHERLAGKILVAFHLASFQVREKAIVNRFPFMLQRRGTIANLAPADGPLLIDDRSLHRGDDLLAIRFLPGNGAVAKQLQELGGLTE